MSPNKFYLIENLQQFSKNTFILYRSEAGLLIYEYAQILCAVECLLSIFRQLNLPKGAGIALQLSGHTPASCALLLSILNHDCHFCPLAADDCAERTQRNLEANGARYLITDTEVGPKHKRPIYKLLRNFSIIEEHFNLFSITSNFETHASIQHDEHLCYTIGTSGSTGAPKMVHVPYACIAPNVRALSARLGLTSHDVIYLCAPLTFDPFVVEFFMALLVGAALLLTPPAMRLAPSKLLSAFFEPSKHAKGVTILQMTPSFLRSFGTDAIQHLLLDRGSSIRALLLGGEEFPTSLELLSWLPVKRDGNTHIYNIYGITELSCWSTIYECNWKDGSLKVDESVPLGAAIDAETMLRIVDTAGYTVSAAGSGELLLGSATRRCYTAPQLQDELFVDGVLFRRTGDLVERNEHGQIYYLGRLNNTIKRLGKRLCLDVLANKITALLHGPCQVRAVCLWDKTLEKLICCLATTNTLELKPHLSQCRRLMQKHLPNAEKPDRVECVSEFPLNQHGKVDRNALLKRLQSLAACSANELKTPLLRFQSFLSETLDLDICVDGGQQEQQQLGAPSASKRHKTSVFPTENLCFTAAGGTSFHALSFALEIGDTLASADDKRQLLEWLLDASVTLRDISLFLANVKVVSSSSIAQHKQAAELAQAQSPTNALCMEAEFELKFRWRVDLGKCIDASPALCEERYICVGSHSRLLLTLDAANGSQVAGITLPDRIECKVAAVAALSPTWLSDDDSPSAFVGCYDGYLYGYDLLRGTIHCRLDCGGMIKAQPLIFNDTIIVCSYASDYNLVCICAKTYKFIWRTRIGNAISAAPRPFANNTLLVCALEGSYARVDAHNGHKQWLHKCQTPIFSTPVLLRNETEIALAEVSGKLHICSAASGEILRTFQAGGNVFSSIVATHAVADTTTDLLLFGSHDGSVYCLKYDAAPINLLTLLWQAPLNAAVYAAPVLLPFRAVLTCSTKGLLTLLALDTGRRLATHDLEAEVFSTPCCLISGRSIYFGCRNNFLYCFDIQNHLIAEI